MILTNFTPKEPSLNIMIKEKPPQYTKHDQLFKQLIEAFFEEFLEALFPNIHVCIYANKTGGPLLKKIIQSQLLY